MVAVPFDFSKIMRDTIAVFVKNEGRWKSNGSGKND